MGPRRLEAERALRRMRLACGIPTTIESRHRIMLPIEGGVGRDYSEAGKFVSAMEVSRKLRQDRHAPVIMRVDSGGGSMAEAIRIVDELKEHRGSVTASVRRRAHSAAGLVYVAADERRAHPHSRFLLHGPSMPADKYRDGMSAKDFRAEADLLDEWRDRMAEFYASRITPMAPGIMSWGREIAEAIDKGSEIGPWEARRLGIVQLIDPNAF